MREFSLIDCLKLFNRKERYWLLRNALGDEEVVPIVRTGNSGFLACLFPHQAAFNNPSW